jgi:hypothetical protein
VPKEEPVWYDKNGMDRYGTDIRDIDNPANIVQLRPDIHKCFDKRWFAIVPKIAGDLEASGTCPQYTAHLLSGNAAELWPQCHNVIVQYLHPRSKPYLFARFAWAVLLWAKHFIVAGFGRNVYRIQVSTDAASSGNLAIQRKEEFLSGKELQKWYGGGGSKTATPRKRKAGDISGANDDGDYYSVESFDSDSSGEEGGYWDDKEEGDPQMSSQTDLATILQENLQQVAERKECMEHTSPSPKYGEQS